ncbi:hypothetical protein [Burkholderia gladioli]|uniref:hypothetical protein n=1 Tax=Burkholderia gladioli TaxID=28095 RepID=UPI001641E6F1|nr:hypothetical protein [Burkholderia gladioli]
MTTTDTKAPAAKKNTAKKGDATAGGDANNAAGTPTDGTGSQPGANAGGVDLAGPAGGDNAGQSDAGSTAIVPTGGNADAGSGSGSSSGDGSVQPPVNQGTGSQLSGDAGSTNASAASAADAAPPSATLPVLSFPAALTLVNQTAMPTVISRVSVPASGEAKVVVKDQSHLQRIWTDIKHLLHLRTEYRDHPEPPLRIEHEGNTVDQAYVDSNAAVPAAK